MSRRLNVLQLINVRWYNACAYYAVSLSLALRRRGHKVIVAGDPSSPPLLKARELGLSVYEDLALSYTSPWMIAYNVKRMRDLIEREGIEIVNAHRGEGHLVAALAKKSLKRAVPLIRTRGDVRTPKRSLLNRYLNNKLTDKIITTCGVLREGYIKNLQMPEDKVAAVPVGIDHDFFSPRESDATWKKRLSIPKQNLVVGIVGRLSPVKGHVYFIQAADHVLRQVPGVTFIVCGEDAQMGATQMKDAVRARNIEENFRFLGKVKDVREIISLFDVGAVSSVGSETICRVALEYMSMGKPVVGTRVNAIPEVVGHQLNGLVVKSRDPQELAAALVELLRDKDKRRQFGRKSRSIVMEEFTLDVFARKIEEIYLGLLN
ncbi:MAG: glycosyltransferase family 4 protein [Candidatus Zixiibacteriota bacterium]|nr:MAG: glycosyltransferase family 4 protein [candidate division Zixibacteria bacterium]